MRRNRDGSWSQFEDQTSFIIQIECLREWIPQTTNSMIPAVIPIPDTLVNYGNNNSNHIVGLCWWRSSPQKALRPQGPLSKIRMQSVACWLAPTHLSRWIFRGSNTKQPRYGRYGMNCKHFHVFFPKIGSSQTGQTLWFIFAMSIPRTRPEIKWSFWIVLRIKYHKVSISNK